MNYDNKIEISKQREYQVVKANEIIQKARYDLNITELKTFAYIVSKIKPTDKIDQEYTISIKDFCQVCGMDYKNGGNYQFIKKTLKALRDKSFWLMDENGVESTVGWLQKARINRGSGKIVVKFDEDIQKYVIGLFNNFTQYSLLSTLPMKSSYSFRMFEILKSYAFAKQHVFDVEELKRLLGAEHYQNFKDFRKKVIEVAVKEINQYTDIEISWEPINKGKKVIEVKFHIRNRDTMERVETMFNAVDQIEGQISMFDYDYYN